MSKIDWTKEQRQAPIGLIIFSIETIRKLLKVLWPILIPFILGGKNTAHANDLKEQIYFYGGILIFVFVMVNSLLSYWFFRFQVIDGELRIKKGYLKKIRLSIPIDRIQTVNIKQNLIHRVLNLVAVEIDTAGGKQVEVKLIAVSKTIANALKEELEKYTFAKEERIAKSENKVIEEPQTILQLSTSDVMKVGLTENHLRSLALIIAIPYWIYSQFQTISQQKMDDMLVGGAQSIEGLHVPFYFWIFIFLLAFFVSVLVSFVLSFIRFYELKLTRQAGTFKLSFGLIQTKEVSIPMAKIQVVSWNRNPLRQLLKFETLKIKQATSDDKIKKKQSIEIPACRLSHQQQIKNAIFGEEEPEFSKPYKSHWLLFVRNFLGFSLIAVLPTVFFWWQDQEYQFAVMFYELFWAVFFMLSYWRRSFRISESQLEITKGNVGKTIYQLQNYKIQAVKFRQNILVKQRGLADVVIYMASGDTLSLPYIPEDIARDIHRFLLYKIESSEEPWM